MSAISYQSLAPEHFAGVISLGNQVHGDNYLDLAGLKDIYNRGFKNNINASWVALEQDKVIGFRLTFAAGNWQPDQWCSPELWDTTVEQTCYFKCNTVDENYRSYGIGSELLKRSVEKVQLQGGKAGLAHIWLASPGNSAYKYFTKCGGQMVKEHPGKWDESDLENGYICPICGKYCDCVAGEMILYFDRV